MTCKDCKYCKECIMSYPDGNWKSCEDFEPKTENKAEVLNEEYRKRVKFATDGMKAEKQTDGDLISRDKAIELVNYALAENKDVLEVLENMPSAENTAEWLPNPDDTAGSGYFICSKCGNDVYETTEHCSNCGRRMKVVK